jgi:hypothetical protein
MACASNLIERFEVIMPDEKVCYTTVLGLPIDLYLPPGLHRICIRILNVTYDPGYVSVIPEDGCEDDSRTRITHVGIQPHLLFPVGGDFNRAN